MYRKSVGKFALVIVLGATIWRADAQSVIDQFNKEVHPSLDVQPLGNDAFGDNINLLDGSLSFRQTDVAIKLTSGLPMTFGRTLSVEAQTADQQGRNTQSANWPLGIMWEADVPYIKIMADSRIGWTGVDKSPSRCTKGEILPPVTGVTPANLISYQAEDYTNGITANIPGYGVEQLTNPPSSSTMPSDGNTYVKVSRNNNWRVRCISGLKKGSGEGFEIVLPDGVTYRFDWMAERVAPYVLDTNCKNNSISVFASYRMTTFEGNFPTTTCWANVAIPRSEYFLFATEAKDRFGNWVRYSFDSANPTRITGITSNEGNSISFVYNPAGQIQTVTAGSRTWIYTYEAAGSFSKLSQVLLPDSISKWVFSYESDFKKVLSANAGGTWDSCVLQIMGRTTDVAATANDSTWMTVKHPSGAEASFKVRKIMHGTKQTQDEEYRCYMASRPNMAAGGYRFEVISGAPSAYQIASIYEKSVSGPGIPSRTQTFKYFPGWTAPFTSRTVVSDSSGYVDTYFYGNNKDLNYGQLLKETHGIGSSISSTKDYWYVESAGSQNYSGYAGSDYSSSRYAWASLFAASNHPLRKTVTTQDGRAYTWEVPADCNGKFCFDYWMRPISVIRGSK